MGLNVTARAQTDAALEEAARALKANIRSCRAALHAVKRAQIGVLGIEVETIETQPEGGHSGDSSENEAEA